MDIGHAWGGYRSKKEVATIRSVADADAASNSTVAAAVTIQSLNDTIRNHSSQMRLPRLPRLIRDTGRQCLASLLQVHMFARG
ncbi:hypothetical protein EVAR_51269_1 [Eumeta japonica]|uniref:Uncharacterized protein n=1 Tax=Eumeta variegata TaxID=151549 RepID=A0A4C1YAG8_EUMVA|nr:hypothetical protein EVAR_51269_1 [Eumeta japonica]